jgi:hypothetical protein
LKFKGVECSRAPAPNFFVYCRWRNKEKERGKEERIEGQTKGGIKRKSRGRNRGE